MYTYEKLYHDLFNAITDALRLMDQGRNMEAGALLIRAQQEAEEHYIIGMEDEKSAAE